MIDYWSLCGVALITIGLGFRLNALLVILVSGVVTGFIAHMGVMEILSAIGASFTKNRYMSLFILILPMIGVLERYGLRQRARDIMIKLKNASAGKIMLIYMILRQVTDAFGLQLGGHPAMVRPLIAPMAEAAASKDKKPSEEQKQKIRALSAASENFGNFFGQLMFVGAGGLLLVKGVFEDNGYEMSLESMFIWAIPTAVFALVIFSVYIYFQDKKLQKDS